MIYTSTAGIQRWPRQRCWQSTEGGCHEDDPKMELNPCYPSRMWKYREAAIHPNQGTEKKRGGGVSPEGFGLSLHEQKGFWPQYDDRWRREWQPTPVFLPRKSQGQRSLVGYSPWGCKELDIAERLHFLFLSKRTLKILLRRLDFII